MLCQYSTQLDEIVISGTKEEWYRLVEIVYRKMGYIQCDTVGSQYYDEIASGIKVSVCNNSHIHTKIDLSGTLILCADSFVLEKLSKLFRSFFEVYQIGEHFHLDYIDSPELMSKDSGSYILVMG